MRRILAIFGCAFLAVSFTACSGGPMTTREKGAGIGALGGAIGFFTSGLVHYNWGDSEVVTVFYFIMGLCLVVERTNQRTTDSSIRV